MKRIIINWIKQYKIHMLVWSLFVLYETFIVGLITGIFGNPSSYIAHYIINITLFYVHASLTMPWAVKNRIAAVWKIPLVMTLEFFVFLLCSYMADKFLIAAHFVIVRDYSFNYHNSLLYLYRYLYFAGFSTGYFYLRRYADVKKRANELEKERLENIIYRQISEQELTKAQNAFLKAQINPHFLFNTLDFIYHNIYTSSPIAADAVIMLSDMMRYAIDSDKIGEFIYLGDEIDQVENLLFLSQMRKGNQLAIQLYYDEKIRGVQFIPLVLLTLVENIIKHGQTDLPGQEAIVRLSLTDDYFTVETDNLISASRPGSSTYTGLMNIEKRLKFAYGQDLSLNYYADKDNHFKLRFSVSLNRLNRNSGTSAVSIDYDKVLPHVNAD